MKNYIVNFMKEHGFNNDAIIFLSKKTDELLDDEILLNVFKKHIDFYNTNTINFKAANMEIESIAIQTKTMHEYTALLLFYILLCENLMQKYKDANIDIEIYNNSVKDLLYKANECYNVYGIWGSFVASWFDGFYTLERFAIGRLQYELISLPHDFVIDGKQFKKDDKVINMHIPSSGKLTKEACVNSFKHAKEFFKLENTLFVCDSWLLWPEHRKFLPADSSIIMFQDFFTIASVCEDRSYHNFWRIFGEKTGKPPYKNLPQNTSLQRAYSKWFDDGNAMGEAFGCFTL